MNKDLVIGLVGTAILVTAMIGVFRFEAAQAGNTFDVAWPTSTVEGPTEEARTLEGETTPVTLNLTTQNVTRIEFTLAWTDDVAQSDPDTFSLRATAPDGTVHEATPSESGTLTLTVSDVALVPQGIRVTASNEDAAERDAARYASQNAVGDWVVEVVMVSAGQTNTAAGELPVPQDNGNEWTLTTQLTVYEAEATRA